MRVSIKDDFKDLLEYREWVNARLKALSAKNKPYLEMFDQKGFKDMNKDKDWFGKDVTYTELVNGITEYKSPELIEKILNKVDNLVTSDIRNRIKAKKLRYNSLGLGVFSYDRAAMGMYRLDEYFSPSLNKVVQSEEVKKTGKVYELISDGSEIEVRKEQRPDGKPKIRTNSKKVFAYFPEVSKDSKSVELFISCGGWAHITAEEFLYSGITAIVIAQLLLKARIKVKISIVVGTFKDDTNYFGSIIPVKNYDETLDINLLALLSSDPRFYRWDGLKGVLATYDNFYTKCPDSFGSGADGEKLKKVLENSGYAEKNIKAQHRYYFGRCFSEEESIKLIKRTINDIANKLNSNG